MPGAIATVAWQLNSHENNRIRAPTVREGCAWQIAQPLPYGRGSVQDFLLRGVTPRRHGLLKKLGGRGSWRAVALASPWPMSSAGASPSRSRPVFNFFTASGVGVG